VLSASQIADEAASYAPVSTPWNWLPFETGASRLTDASGNGHNATQVGTLTDGIEAPLTSVVPVVAIPWFAFA
jgi:pheromone shutdown protein TraB